MDWVVAVPAYGRDYKTAKEVREAWANGRDFRIMPSGQYINKSDADKYNVAVQLRYDRRTKVIGIQPRGGKPTKPEVKPEVKQPEILSIGNVLDFKRKGGW
jgi:hypothetical protein